MSESASTSERSAQVASFTIERSYPAAPRRVFAASAVQRAASGRGSGLRYVEQCLFLDGQDTPAAREHGTRELLTTLGERLQGEEGG